MHTKVNEMGTHANISSSIMHLFALGKNGLEHTNMTNLLSCLCTICWEILDFIVYLLS